MPIESYALTPSEAGFNIRARGVCRALDIDTLGELTEIEPVTLLSQRNCGEGTLAHIRERLRAHGLYLRGEQAPSLPAELDTVDEDAEVVTLNTAPSVPTELDAVEALRSQELHDLALENTTLRQQIEDLTASLAQTEQAQSTPTVDLATGLALGLELIQVHQGLATILTTRPAPSQLALALAEATHRLQAAQRLLNASANGDSPTQTLSVQAQQTASEAPQEHSGPCPRCGDLIRVVNGQTIALMGGPHACQA